MTMSMEAVSKSTTSPPQSAQRRFLPDVAAAPWSPQHSIPHFAQIESGDASQPAAAISQCSKASSTTSLVSRVRTRSVALRRVTRG